VSHEYAVQARHERFTGGLFTVVSDEVTMPDGGTAMRDCLRHPGAAAVVAVGDDRRVLLLYQYRHAVGRKLWEIPAGLLDPGESPAQAASRELAEEVDLAAANLVPLLEIEPCPGYSNEVVHVFLARDLSPRPTPHVRRHEEAEMQVRWFDLAEAVEMALRKEITNGATVAGLLAADRLLP
jgi:8-oxo-dGDP phosphatase